MYHPGMRAAGLRGYPDPSLYQAAAAAAAAAVSGQPYSPYGAPQQQPNPQSQQMHQSQHQSGDHSPIAPRGPNDARGTPPAGGYAGPNPYAAMSPADAAYMGYYPHPMGPPAPVAGFAAGYHPGMFPRPGPGRGQYFPGGRNWVGARPPPPGQPGFSSGLQVVVHNLPWDCTWQQLKDAFSSCGEIERADVVFDSRGRSRGFGIVRFPNRDSAELAVDKMNNQVIGGRVVSVRLDRFA